MFRNPEVRKETVVYAITTLLVAGIAFLINPLSSVFVLVSGVALTAVHLFFTQERYSRIAELSENLNRILLGQQSMLINKLNEGELSILNSEIHKMTLRLKEQTDILLSDKQGLTNAIEDIFHQKIEFQ